MVLIGVGLPISAAAETGFVIQDSHVASPVGMAADFEYQRYWAAAGGSGQLRVWAVDPTGVPLGPAASLDQTVSVQALAAVDDDLYVGDIGGLRLNLTVWKMTGPVPTTTTRAAKSYRLRYPDGSHYAKAMMVDAKGRVYVVTTGSAGKIYRTPKKPSSDELTVLEQVGDAPSPRIVDAVMLANGKSAMRSAANLYLLDEVFNKISSEKIPDQPDGGALALALDGKSLVAAAGSGGSAELMALPPEPEQQASDSEDSASKTKPKKGSSNKEKSVLSTIPQTGTAIAVVGALGVAALAGLVVLVRR